jgi:hypothetical protein
MMTSREVKECATLLHCKVFGSVQMELMSDNDVLDRCPSVHRDEVANGLAVATPRGKDFRDTKAFVKSEAYTEMKDGRVITPLNPVIQAHMYKMTYPLQDALHRHQWFAFGRSCVEVANHIANVSREAMFRNWVCVEGDFSRFDGTLSKPTRQIEEKLYRKVFSKHGGSEYVQGILDGTHHVRYVGTKQNSEYARCSGSPDTCLMNSLQNWLVTARAMSPEFASKFCLFGGDDSIIFMDRKDVHRIAASAAKHGFRMKIKVTTPGKPFSFLGRLYNWGSPNSIADPDRVLPKVHVVSSAVAPKY